MLDKATWTRSVEVLSDTAEIVLPGTVYNTALEVEGKIRRGDAVLIRAGYGKMMTTEFVGYVQEIRTDGGSITILCEDGLFLYRTDVPDKELNNVTLTAIVAYLHQTVKSMTVSCDYELTYDKFTIHGATAYDVLKQLQGDTKANIYLKDNVLHMHPQYSEIFGTADYDFAHNIDKQGTELKYRDATDRKLLVTVDAKDKKGKTIRIEEGTTGGDKLSLSISGVSDEASLRKIAQETLAQKVYSGYEGAIRGWLVPACDAGYSVGIHDADYVSKNGRYYALEVKSEIGSTGGIRTIKLGKRI